MGLPTCLLCTCLGGSVYCDDVKLETVPPLPKDTTHFYARYNKITKINKSDFANMNNLKRIDVTSNKISRIDEDALADLPALEELVLRENSVTQLPALPASMTLIDASHNKLGSKGIQREALRDMHGLLYLYLTDNDIDHIPMPLPHSLRSLHLQNNNIQMMHEDTFCNLHDRNYVRNALEDIRLDGNPINLSKTPQAYMCLPLYLLLTWHSSDTGLTRKLPSGAPDAVCLQRVLFPRLADRSVTQRIQLLSLLSWPSRFSQWVVFDCSSCGPSHGHMKTHKWPVGTGVQE
ncbi:hypothetical protein AAFF_G00167840 [Aldrovandia affinis]|uniref:LRRNT domain-containing protein n=1 Tax=Aldrovandia affinis TaxID=143900 RepID=A0AAD7W7X4_9TELE|nr:hypothetical protein AAFF_G00167840 [Aldrovandia affinis]